ncbi:MAG: LysR family transcriptional regulator, partial [Roseibium sp.]|nr:LysR family transcriptional regulator [Roseibium sp.]
DYLDRNWESRGPKGEGLQWIGWGDGVPVPDWVRASPFPKARVRYELNSPTLIAKLVAEGVGMSRFPVIAASWIDGMIPVPGTEPYLDRSVWIMRHSELRQTIRVQLLVDHLARELQAMRPAFLGPLYKA